MMNLMNRREFARTLGIGAAAISIGSLRTSADTGRPQVAVTMDDFSWSQNTVRLNGEERNRAILETLKAHSIKAALFVVGRNIDNEEGKALLRKWDDAGHMIGNHSYSHRNYAAASMTAAAFGEDILHAETLLREFARFRKYFRFPMLKEGETAAKRDAMRAFLAQHGYRTGHVTIDNSDWCIDQRLTKKLSSDSAANVAPYRDFYLEHMWDRAQYYDLLARQTLGHPIRHTILMHFNLLNSLFLGDLLDMFRGKGWELIDAEAAFGDPVFAAKPNVVPAGESIVWSLAKATGKIDKQLRYPAEDAEYEIARMDKLGL
jgi:peptidoglycan-N-acetylglucosamine deacetylase